MKKVIVLLLLPFLSGCVPGLHNYVTSYTSTGEVEADFNLGIPVTRHLSSGLAPSNNGLAALAIDAQRQVVIASQENGDFVAEVLSEVGTSASMFGTDGVVNVGFDSDESTFMSVGDIAVVRGPEGLSTGFVIAGYEYSSPEPRAIALAKFSISGIDHRFGSGGKVITRIPSFESQVADSLLFARSGKILVVGATTPIGAPSRSAVLRYHPDGRLDTSFGTSGVAQVSAPDGGWAGGESIAIDSRDRIVTAGSSGLRGMISRLDSTGAIDTSFGDSGIVIVEPIGDTRLTARHLVAIDTRDRIVYVSTTQESARRLVVFRFTTSGELDTAFGDRGRVFLSPQIQCADLAIDSMGRIVVVGTTRFSPTTTRMVISRLLPDGRADASFSEDGVLISDRSLIPRTVAIGRNDSIVVGGLFIKR